MNLSARVMDRFRVAVILAAGGTFIAVLCVTLLSALGAERRRLETEIEEKRSQLAMKDFLRGPDVLKKELNRESIFSAKLRDEWSNTVQRIVAFRDVDALRNADIGSIDYKIALIEGRDRLRKKARNMDIRLQKDWLNMDSKVSSSEDARQLMLHLRAAETLVDVALDIKTESIRFVEPVERKSYKIAGFSETYLEEYPVKIQFYGTIETLYDFLKSISNEEHFFVLRQLRVEASAKDKPDVLCVTAVAGALLFTKNPDQITSTIEEKKTPIKIGPRGY